MCRALIGALAVLATVGVGTAAAAPFELGEVENRFIKPNTTEEVTQAAAHPDLISKLTFPSTDKTVRDIIVEQPAGFYGNPESLPQCNFEQLLLGEGYCSTNAQVGTISTSSTSGFGSFPLYNMESSVNQVAVLSAVVLSVPVKLIVSVRTDGDYGLTIRSPNINQALELPDIRVEVWGVPQDKSHDAKRCSFLFSCGVSSTDRRVPFLTLPSRCGEPLHASALVRSWEEPDNWVSKSIESPAQTGCESLDFSPSLEARPTTTATDAPSGLDFDLKIPFSDDPDGLASANLREARVVLPEGFVINPAGGNGLEGCRPAQIHLTTPSGVVPNFANLPPECPEASRLGSVEVETPVLGDPLVGSIYAATPYDNPFDSLLAIYLAFSGPGLDIKLAGEIRPDPKTGRLTTIFGENPQTPFENFKLNFFGGAFAPLRTPSICGTFSTTTQMTPWSAPASGPAATPSDTYAISGRPGQGNCPTTKAALPNTPSFEAGSTAALAGKYQPFVVNLRREDATQEFSTVTLNPPPGLVGKLAGTAICSDAALAAAGGKSGSAEQSAPSCPAKSEVGRVFAGAGAGPAPYNTSGKVYVAGPYKGAPLSLAIITPAVAGPFDLGTIVVRTAVFIDSRTAQITAKADPIPPILKGIPLDVRSVSIRLDRPNFMLNPTSCDPTSVRGSLLTLEGATAALSSRFQLAECGRLALKPRLSLSLKGGTKRGDFPSLRAVLRPPAGSANISRAQVTLPHSEFLAQEHIGTVCTRVQFAADKCPAAAIYGKVQVTTPLLDEPLTGPIYLRSSNNPLPDLVLDLHGPASRPIRFEAAGRTDSVNGGIRNTFSFVPDVPFTKLSLQLFGGKKGLLVNSRNICNSVSRAKATYDGHNGLAYSANPVLKPQCAGKKKSSKAKKGNRGNKPGRK